MAEILLINPARRKGRTMARKKLRSAAQRRATAKLVAMNRSRRSGRRKARSRNPISTTVARAAVARRARRPARRASNPVSRTRIVRRRRNPILPGLTVRGVMSQVQDALIGAGGAVAVDVAYARINPMLPATLQTMPGSVSAGNAVKAVITIALGKLLNRASKGLSGKMAQGALTVQAHGIVAGLMPAGLLSYYSPARIVQGTNRVGPMRGANGMQAYLPPGTKTPLLNAYMRSGATPLLSGSSNAREREGVSLYR